MAHAQYQAWSCYVISNADVARLSCWAWGRQRHLRSDYDCAQADYGVLETGFVPSHGHLLISIRDTVTGMLMHGTAANRACLQAVHAQSDCCSCPWNTIQKQIGCKPLLQDFCSTSHVADNCTPWDTGQTMPM